MKGKLTMAHALNMPMERFARELETRGYTSLRAAKKVVAEVSGADLNDDTDARGWWYRNRGKEVGKIIILLQNQEMTIDRIADMCINRRDIRKALEYARRFGFVKLEGYGVWSSTGKHLTLKQS